MNHCEDDNLKPNTPDCMRRGHKKLAPGVYTCSDPEHLHIVAPELCRANGYAPTEQNINTLVKAALELYAGNLKVLP